MGIGEGCLSLRIGKMTKGDGKLFSYFVLKTLDLKNVNQQCSVHGHSGSHENIYNSYSIFLNYTYIYTHDFIQYTTVFVFLFFVTNNSK